MPANEAPEESGAYFNQRLILSPMAIRSHKCS
jgi:hypothetical protein